MLSCPWVLYTLLSLEELGLDMTTLVSAPGPRCPVSGPEQITTCALLPTSGVLVSGSSSTISPGPEKHALVRVSELETELGDKRPANRLRELSILA